MLHTIFKKYSCFNANAGLLVLRIGIALIFIMAGYMKLADMQSTISMFSSLGLSAFWAYIVTFIELIGGIAILFGAYTRIWAFFFAIIMLVAFIITYKNMPQMAMYPASIFFTSVALLLAGGGSHTVMKIITQRCCGCKVKGTECYNGSCTETCSMKKQCCDGGTSETCCGVSKTETTESITQ